MTQPPDRPDAASSSGVPRTADDAALRHADDDDDDPDAVPLRLVRSASRAARDARNDRRAAAAAAAAERRRSASVVYDPPDSYARLDDAHALPPVQDPDEEAVRRVRTLEEDNEEPLRRRPSLARSARASRRRSHASSSPSVRYDAPDSYAHLDELADVSPVQNPAEASLYRHRSLEQVRSREPAGSLSGPVQTPPPPSRPPEATEAEGAEEEGVGAAKGEVRVSRRATQIYTVSYLVLFSILGTLARLGLQALTTYPGTPVLFPSLWPNFAGSLVLGFLAEDRMLFRHGWGGDGDGGGDAASAAAKKTVPLYVGLATGFCGSFTSFSAFLRDVFLALANELPASSSPRGPPSVAPPPRHGGYSFLAVVAVVLVTVCAALGGLFVGAHAAIAFEPLVPSVPAYALPARRWLDRLAVLLAWCCWLAAVLLCALPRGDAASAWPGRPVVFALAFAPLGCLARFYASLVLNARLPAFPLGTFAVNVAGCAVLAAAYDLAHAGSVAAAVVSCQVLQGGVEDGFCGCLTTVSTWAAELAALRRRHAYAYGAASVLASLALMVAVMGGLRWTDGFARPLCGH